MQTASTAARLLAQFTQQQPLTLCLAGPSEHVPQREDLRALAVVLLECLLSALALGGPSPGTAAESVQRLLGEVFGWDVPQFQRYCQEEPDWHAAVELLSLDGGAGWRLLQQLVEGGGSAAQLADTSPFCRLP